MKHKRNSKSKDDQPAINQSPRKSDLVGDILIRSKNSALPRSYREKFGPTEPMFASACGLEFLHEVLTTLKVIHSGISAIHRQSSLAKLFMREVRPNGPTHKLARDVVTNTSNDVEQAKLITESDFDSINSLAVVAICTVYEVATEDTLKSILMFSPGLIKKVQGLGVRVESISSERDLNYDEASYATKRLKEWCRKKNKDIPEGDILAFNCLGVSINPSEKTRTSIRELYYVRNCIVHRGKRADEKCREEAPRLNLVNGDIFSVRRSDMGLYVEALSALLAEIFETINAKSIESAISARKSQKIDGQSEIENIGEQKEE